MKKRLVMGMMGISSILNSPLSVLAGNLDGMSSGSTGSTGSSSLNADDAAIGDIIRNHRGTTAEQMATASNALSPFTNFCGTVVGGAIALIYAGVFVITAADLLYISLPPLRPLLLRNQQGEGSKLQLISDEALSIVANGGNGGGSSSGGDMMGGGFGAQPQSSGSGKSSSKIVAYFKARFVFMIFLVITTMVLTSSVIMGTGVNLAEWGLKLLQSFNDFIPV